MLDLLSSEQTYLAVLLIVPGFVSLKVYGLLSGRTAFGAGDVVEAFTYGCVNFGLWFVPLELWITPWAAASPARLTAAAALVLLVSPAGLAIGARGLLLSRRMRAWMPHPTASSWDYVFGLRREAWIRVRRADGSMVGGFFGPESFASSFAEKRDVYIEQAWALGPTGEFTRAVDDSAGVMLELVDGDVIEFYNANRGANHGRPEDTTT